MRRGQEEQTVSCHPLHERFIILSLLLLCFAPWSCEGYLSHVHADVRSVSHLLRREEPCDVISTFSSCNTSPLCTSQLSQSHSSSSTSSFVLYSSPFDMDDDEDLDWDAEDDDDDDDDDEFMGLSEMDDDTDESYYERLFLQQQNLVSEKKEQDDVEEERAMSLTPNIERGSMNMNMNGATMVDLQTSVSSSAVATTITKEKPRSNQMLEDLVTTSTAGTTNSATQAQKANEEKEIDVEVDVDVDVDVGMDVDTSSELEKQWRVKMHNIRSESIQTRKQQRQKLKRRQMEERATFLALRALRLQSLPPDPSLSLPSDTSSESEEEKENKSKIKNKYHQHTFLMPTPPLSLSASRNYKRRDDYAMLNGSNDDDDHCLIKMEQKLYGKRFKASQQVYIRLLETLEDMRLEAKTMASDLIADRVEEEVAMSMNIGAGVNNRGGGSICYEQRAEEVEMLHLRQQVRMSTVVSLSLNGNYIFSKYYDGDGYDGHDWGSHHRNLPKIDIHDVQTRDLAAILRIRGNVKRRGRLPKMRSKVLEQLQESYTIPLF